METVRGKARRPFGNTLETFLVEWKRQQRAIVEDVEKNLETFLVEWKLFPNDDFSPLGKALKPS